MSILQLVEKCTPQEWQVPLDLSPLPDQGSDKGLWIDPVTVLNGWALAVWAMGLAQRPPLRLAETLLRLEVLSHSRLLGYDSVRIPGLHRGALCRLHRCSPSAA